MSKNFSSRFFTSIILFLLIYLIFLYDFILIYSLLIIGVISLLEFFNASNKVFKNNLIKFFCNVIFSVYTFLLCFFFLLFCIYFNTKLIIFIILFGCIASDIGGYLFGKTFKGPKLTKISPKKTISGSIGSLILTTITILTLTYYYKYDLNFKIIIVSLITSLSCQSGDIFFSFIKRKAKLKDFGNFLPGHGGILDRVDGIFFGLPIGFITLILIQ
tara:strand:+ start:196 stop:843 length:648 start_codon:yes stop_codon:yes gene_type:complete